MNDVVLALDVGTRRIGIARADTGTKLAFPVETIVVDGTEVNRLQQIIDDTHPSKIVVGYPRNQSGEPTAQTDLVLLFVERLKTVWDGSIVFQDESLTSVLAEERLRQRGKPYSKGSIDAEAAAIILQDFLEALHGY